MALGSEHCIYYYHLPIIKSLKIDPKNFSTALWVPKEFLEGYNLYNTLYLLLPSAYYKKPKN